MVRISIFLEHLLITPRPLLQTNNFIMVPKPFVTLKSHILLQTSMMEKDSLKKIPQMHYFLRKKTRRQESQCSSILTISRLLSEEVESPKTLNRASEAVKGEAQRITRTPEVHSEAEVATYPSQSLPSTQI